LQRQGKPICITNCFVDKPCFIIIIGLLVLLGLSYFAYEQDLFKQFDQHPREFLIYDDPKTFDWDKQVAAEEYFTKQRDDQATALRTQKMQEL